MNFKIKSTKKYVAGSINTFKIVDMRNGKKTKEVRCEVIACNESTSAFIKNGLVYELTLREML